MALRDLDEIRAFFSANRTPVYFFHSAPSTLFGADGWINHLKFISSVDAFDGEHPNAFVPDCVKTSRFATAEDAVNCLLADPAVSEYVGRFGTGGKALFLVFDQRTELLADKLQLDICFPPESLRRRLDDKIIATRIADAAGVRAAPHIVTAVDSYDTLRRASSRLGDDLVLQLPYGDGGRTTFFISEAEDFDRYRNQIVGQPAVKVMTRIACQSLTIEGCVTRHGTLVGPLLTEIIGLQELTPYTGGWCGDELFGDHESGLSRNVRYQALDATRAIGEQIRKEGYLGNFGVDFLLARDTGELYFGELNPRLTGVTLLTAQAALDREEPPLLLFHLLEWLGEDYVIDVQQFNDNWVMHEPRSAWSSLVIHHVMDSVAGVASAPQGGLWRMDDDETIHFVRRAFTLQAIDDEREAIFFRSVNIGQAMAPGDGCGRLLMRGRVTSASGQLNARARAWLSAFRSLFVPRSRP